MKILKDGFRADMERIKRELTVLQGVSIHVGILGDAGSDILMIAGVHEYRRPESEDYWLWARAFFDAPIFDLQAIAALVQ